MLARVFGLVARLNGMCPAAWRHFLLCSFVQPARRAGVRACSCILACRSIERHVPCGHEGFSFSAVLAASGGGRWGPVRGCRPSEAPSALPPDDPAGFVVYPTLPRTGLQGPSISHHSTRAARLLLRELPRCARRSPCAPRNAITCLHAE